MALGPDNTDFLEPRAARGIAAQEIKQINLNLGAEPRNRGALDGSGLARPYQIDS